MRSPKSKSKSARAIFAASPSVNAISDPFLSIGRRATASVKRGDIPIDGPPLLPHFSMEHLFRKFPCPPRHLIQVPMISIETLANITLPAGKRATLVCEKRFPLSRIVGKTGVGVSKERLGN